MTVAMTSSGCINIAQNNQEEQKRLTIKNLANGFDAVVFLALIFSAFFNDNCLFFLFGNDTACCMYQVVLLRSTKQRTPSDRVLSGDRKQANFLQTVFVHLLIQGRRKKPDTSWENRSYSNSCSLCNAFDPDSQQTLHSCYSKPKGCLSEFFLFGHLKGILIKQVATLIIVFSSLFVEIDGKLQHIALMVANYMAVDSDDQGLLDIKSGEVFSFVDFLSL
ncbi:hypothetical protein BD560DRAFT_493414 [Blakeslea trispora]|nr:hypothetical protein BD560DRAFT_493414 [Blakeslea trispora]